MHTPTGYTTRIVAVGAPIFGAPDERMTRPHEVTVTSTPADDRAEPPSVLDAELAVSVNHDLAAAILTAVEAVLGGAATPSVRARLLQAEDHFYQARGRWAAEDPHGAGDRASRAWAAIIDALSEGGGPRSVDEMIEGVVTRITQPSKGDSPEGGVDLRSTLRDLLDRARRSAAVSRSGIPPRSRQY